MKTLYKFAVVFLLLLASFVAQPFQTTIAHQEVASPTPTYDPFVEPLLPLNPTDYELGQNLYWHWCMTCHGDRGQGLTDEFRDIWEPDHQNCWAHGCHAGKEGDMGFPIPTVVPGVVKENRLSQFSSVQELSDYLKATHPPQSPGVLKDEEYDAIALFVFTMNGRLPVSVSSTPTPVSIETVVPSQPPASHMSLMPVGVIVIVFSVIVLFIMRRIFSRKG